jgi:hypothetical protein
MPGSILLQDNSNSGPVTGGALAITTSDATVYNPPLRGLYANVSGTIAIVFADGSTFSGTLATGVIHPIAGISKIMATGTTATGIYAFKG